MSAVAVFVLLCMDIGVVIGIYVLRYHLYSEIGEDSIYVAAIMNALQILVLNSVYMNIAGWLSEMENNRTGTATSQ